MDSAEISTVHISILIADCWTRREATLGEDFLLTVVSALQDICRVQGGNRCHQCGVLLQPAIRSIIQHWFQEVMRISNEPRSGPIGVAVRKECTWSCLSSKILVLRATSENIDNVLHISAFNIDNSIWVMHLGLSSCMFCLWSRLHLSHQVQSADRWKDHHPDRAVQNFELHSFRAAFQLVSLPMGSQLTDCFFNRQFVLACTTEYWL